MALSGTIYGAFSGLSTSNARPYLTWSGIQNIAGNYTDITVNVYFTSTSGYYAYNNANNHTCYINIDGSNDGAIANFNLNAYSTVLVRTRTYRVYHNSDGSKNCWIGSNGDPLVGWGTYNFGQTVTLDTIPREAFITNSVNFQVGNNIPLTINNAGSMYVKSELYVNGVLIKTTNHGQVTSATITLSGGDNSNIYAQMPNSTSQSMYVRIKTYSDAGYSSQIGGNRDQSGTVTIDQTINKPVFTTYSLENVDKNIDVVDKYGNTLVTSSTATLLGSSSKMIKGYSKVRGTILVANKAVPQNSATMNKYRLTNGSQYAEQSFSGVADVNIDLDNVLTNSFVMTAFDSRSLSTDVAGSLSFMADYAALLLYGMTVTRDNSVDALTKLAFSGTFWNKYFGSGSSTPSGVNNTLTVQYRWRLSTRTDFQSLDGTATISIASPAVVTKTAHGLATGDQVYLQTTGALPTGLSANTTYYVIYVDANTFRLATSLANAQAGTAINTSGSQSGTHTLRVDGQWTTITPTVDGSGNVSYNTYINGDLGASGFSTDKSFVIELRGYDKLSQIIVEQTLSVGIPLMDFYRASGVHAVAFNAKYSPSEGGTVQIDGKHIKKYIGELLYPVGSIYINATNNTNPATLLGFGTWSAFGAGRVPVGYNSGDSDFNASEKTGGSKTQTLATGDLAAHAHTLNRLVDNNNFSPGTINYRDGRYTTINDGSAGRTAFSGGMNNAGSGNAHNNLQPYITVYMWKRTA